MDEVSENLIAIRKRDVGRANKAFADLMSLTEKCLDTISLTQQFLIRTQS